MKSVMVNMPGVVVGGQGQGGPASPLGTPPAPRSPTKLCFLLSHSGAARTPLVTSAKKAFFTCSRGHGEASREAVGTPRQPPAPNLLPTPPAHLQGGVKDDQFGAGGDQVVAAVGLHEGGVGAAVGLPWGRRREATASSEGTPRPPGHPDPRVTHLGSGTSKP